MKPQDTAQFAEGGARKAPTMMAAMKAARAAVAELTGLPVDSVAQCLRDGDGPWRVTVDVIEVPARIGDNDLLATFEVLIGDEAEVQGFERRGRYHREDGGA